MPPPFLPLWNYPSKCLATWWWYSCPCQSGTARAQSPGRAWIHGKSLRSGCSQGSGETQSVFHHVHQGRTNTWITAQTQHISLEQLQGVRLVQHRGGGKQKLNDNWRFIHLNSTPISKNCCTRVFHTDNHFAEGETFLKQRLPHYGIKLSKQRLSPRLWLDVDVVSLVSPRNKPHTGTFLHALHRFLYQLCVHFSCLFC